MLARGGRASRRRVAVSLRRLASARCPARAAIPLRSASTAARIGSGDDDDDDDEDYAFSFGLIADIQYCDVEDGTNFREDEVRCYRGALTVLDHAIQTWNAEAAVAAGDRRGGGGGGGGVDFATVMQMGDLIDGQNTGTYGAGLDFPAPQSEAAWAAVQDVIGRSSRDCGDWHHLIGNHELYNFEHRDMAVRLEYARARVDDGPGAAAAAVAAACGSDPDAGSDGSFGNYYSFSPRAGWRFIVLDSYAESMLGREADEPSAVAAMELLARNNPNPLDGTADFTRGLQGPNLRFLPYNAALGEEQLQWLRQRLALAHSDGERVAIFAHVPLHPAAAAYASVAWDFADALATIRDTPPGLVAAVFSGHHHSGGYATDRALGSGSGGIGNGGGGDGGGGGGSGSERLIHYVTVQSPLTNHAKGVPGLKGGRIPLSAVRAYDDEHVAAARRRAAAAEKEQESMAAAAAGEDEGENAGNTGEGEGSLGRSPGTLANDEFAPFATVHVHRRHMFVHGRGAVPSRQLDF